VRSKIVTALAAAFLFLCSAVAMNAQDNTNRNQQTPARHHMAANNNNEAATGCLQQRTNGSGYSLAAQDGSTWQVSSNAMDLSKYVGKEVTVAGMETGSNPGHLSRVSTSQHESGHGPMDVLDLAVVNESCQK
jgi:hypothetical protein